MNFDLTEEQRLLAESVRRFVARDYTFEARRRIVESAPGFSEDAWKAFAALGLLALTLPAEHGGFDGEAADLMEVMEAFGEALVVEPFVSTLLCARLVARGGDDATKARLLPAVGEGTLRLALAHGEEGARYALAHVEAVARAADGGYVLRGRKRAVLHAPQAEMLLVPARSSGAVGDEAGISLFVVDAAAVAMRPWRTIDGLRGADVELEGVRAQARLGEEGGAFPLIDEAVDFATALVCAEAVGAMRYANEATLEYLRTRRQFGVPIGSFQALQHRMVDMVIAAEQARSMASVALAAVRGGRPPAERRRLVSAAKIRVSEACRHVAHEAVQLHGGMGMSEELKVSHAFRRLAMIARQFGDADHHLERFAACPA